MGCNVAFYDPKKRRLVGVERLDVSRESAAVTAMQLGLMWLSGRHRMPSPYWVVWDNVDDLGVFPLDQADSDEFRALPESMLDHIVECAGKVRSGR